jgi:hypothetical protein
MKNPTFLCSNPTCNVRLEISPDQIGEKYKCPKCSQYGIVPNPNETTAESQIKPPKPALPASQESLEVKAPEPLPEECLLSNTKEVVARSKSTHQGRKFNLFMDFMTFKIMITPVIIKIGFGMLFVFTFLAIISQLFLKRGVPTSSDLIYLTMYEIPSSSNFILKTITLLVFLTIFRIFCEFLVVLFCINGKISDLQKNQ